MTQYQYKKTQGIHFTLKFYKTFKKITSKKDEGCPDDCSCTKCKKQDNNTFVQENKQPKKEQK